MHSGPGCAEKLERDFGSSGYFSSHIFPCTNMSEKEVIFGGERKLKETIENALKVVDADFYGYPLIIGSSWEKKIANETKAHYIAISWPVFERLIINSFYVGYDGGLKLLEDIYSVVLTRFN
ncbi:nitrogenase component 1 [Clostridium tyrobutyricum]|uniref:nitrogenase component 1 n=1 Tax=Clostridium tyrobutyricum TaxID=1519 RepID=UPI0020CDA8B3|nr:nitrogenase component 1 [Clostridium tyrobutyricum]